MAKMLVQHAKQGELWEYGRSLYGDGDSELGPNKEGWYFIVDDEDMADWQGPFDSEAQCWLEAIAYGKEYDESVSKSADPSNIG